MRGTSATPGEHIYGKAKLRVYDSREQLGEAAASDAADIIRRALAERGESRIMIATGNSQLDVVRELVKQPGIDWSAVEIFHMDEYIGIAADHPASFRRWIRERVEEKLPGARMHYIEGDVPDIDAEIRRYTELLSEGPLDLAFVGFGENGHIAFNDPPSANFQDPAMVKRVTLDAACRHQQVGEGHFESLASVPAEALTVSCSGLLRARSWVCCVPESRKALAVRNALLGPISTECPASIVRTHPHALIYLNTESAELLNL